MNTELENLITSHAGGLKELVGTSLSIEECRGIIRSIACESIHVNRTEQTQSINDHDIATLEVLHDALLYQGIFGMNHTSMKNSRKLTKKMRGIIETKTT